MVQGIPFPVKRRGEKHEKLPLDRLVQTLRIPLISLPYFQSSVLPVALTLRGYYNKLREKHDKKV
jgi:hypothetical protein